MNEQSGAVEMRPVIELADLSADRANGRMQPEIERRGSMAASNARLASAFTLTAPSEEECNTFEAGRYSMRQGVTGTLDQLAGHLATD